MTTETESVAKWARRSIALIKAPGKTTAGVADIPFLEAVAKMAEALEIASDVMESQAGLLEIEPAFAVGVAAALKIAGAEARAASKVGS